jgi:hypothetical protein
MIQRQRQREKESVTEMKGREMEMRGLLFFFLPFLTILFISSESRQREEAKLAEQRIKRRETRLHDEAERQARADRAEAEALAQLQETRQTIRRKKSDFDSKRKRKREGRTQRQSSRKEG